MPVYNSFAMIDDLQQQTENFLQVAVGQWQMLPQDILSAQADTDSWSAIQCLEHLNSYGSYYLPAIEKAIKTAENSKWPRRPNFKSGWLGNYFTNMMKLGKNGQIKKMKAPKEHTPVCTPNNDAVLAEFINQQETMMKLLERARSLDLERPRVPISIAPFIKLKLGDVCNFLVAHNKRHIVQAKKAVEIGKMQKSKFRIIYSATA